jgi:hypothetical protein
VHHLSKTLCAVRFAGNYQVYFILKLAILLEVISKTLFFAFGLPFWRFSFAALKLSNSGQGPQTGDNFLTRHSTETGFQNGKIALKNIFEMDSS